MESRVVGLGTRSSPDGFFYVSGSGSIARKSGVPNGGARGGTLSAIASV
jgi:hypothetical protein